ncbi:MAG: thiamine biosynthesis protein ThiC [Erythrobacter sp.]
MDFTQQRTVQIVAILLLLAAATQALYTGLYIAEVSVPREILWGGEGLLFVILAAFAGSALATTKRYSLGFSAIAFAAVLNVVQVGIGLTQFGPFREASGNLEALEPVAASVVALSFFIYNAAKILLGLAALVFGLGCLSRGGKIIGPLTVLVGVIAMITNTFVMSYGLSMSITGGGIMPSGASGVLATILLGICVLGLSKDD